VSTPCARCDKPTDAAVCHRCATSLAQALTEAAGHAEDVWTVLARQTRYGTGGGARKPEPEPAGVDLDERRNRVTEFGWAASMERPPVGALRSGPIPPDLDAGASLEEIADTVLGVAWDVCAARGIELSARRPLYGPVCEVGRGCPHQSCASIWHRRPPSQLAEALAWLATQTAWLRVRPDAEQAFDRLHEACDDLRRLVDRPADDVLVGMCDCGRTLYAPPWRPIVTCKPCGLHWDVAESRRILRDNIDDQLMTATEAARIAVRLTDGDRSTEQVRNLISLWAHRGQLAVKGELDGKATYRFGDVVDRLAGASRRGAA
jgi:hypothetical protein